MQNEREKSQEFLNFYARANSGLGLIVPKAMAEDLREMGINGPFHEQKPLPVSFDGLATFKK